LLKSGVTALAYETIEVNRRLPLLEPMSEIAGRMSVLVGGYFLAKHTGGSGVLLGGVPGVLPGRVVVIGGGASGINAARMATGLGADVTILEVDLERMRFLDITLHTAHTLYSNEAHLMDLLPTVDLLIGAVLVPGAKAPKLINRSMLKQMRREVCWWISRLTRAVALRLAGHDASEPGLCGGRGDALLRGQHARGVCPHGNAGADECDASVCGIAGDLGLAEACLKQPALVGGINIMDGKVTHKAVADAHGLPYVVAPLN